MSIPSIPFSQEERKSSKKRSSGLNFAVGNLGPMESVIIVNGGTVKQNKSS